MPPLSATDYTESGFGTSGFIHFTTAATPTSITPISSRLLRVIRGGRKGISVLGIGGFCIWDTALGNTFGGICLVSQIQVVRCSVQIKVLPDLFASTNPGDPGQIAARLPPGFEVLFWGSLSSPGTSTPTAAGSVGYTAVPPKENWVRFLPGELFAGSDQQLFVVMSCPVNWGALNIYPEVVDHYRLLTVTGIDYGATVGTVDPIANTRSYPRF